MVGQWGFSVTDKGAEIGIVGWESDGGGRYEAITRSDSTGLDIDLEVIHTAHTHIRHAQP